MSWKSTYKWIVTSSLVSPPPVDPNVGRPSEPGVEDVDAADCIRSQQSLPERRVVVEPQALPEPVDRIIDHHSSGRVFRSFLNDNIVSVLSLARLGDTLNCPRETKKGAGRNEVK